MRHGLVPGHNVDRIDIQAGLRELVVIGYTCPMTTEVIAYALQRWARGEEEQATRGAIDWGFHGIDLTAWYRVLAAAQAAVAQNIMADVPLNAPVMVYPPAHQ